MWPFSYQTFPTLISPSYPWYLFKVDLLFIWVSVIKSHDQFAIEQLLVVLVEKGSLGMAYVEIATHM